MRTSDLVEDMTKGDSVHRSHMPESAIGMKSNEEIKAEANTGRYQGSDPVGGVMQEENVPGFKPGFDPTKITKLSTETDPVFGKSGFAIGDKIYHKVQKQEGVVKDMLASGSIIVKFANGKKGRTNPKNLVKL